MDKDVLLFDLACAASRVAWMLRAEYDGCNAIVLQHPEQAALRVAAAIAGTQWCYLGAACNLRTHKTVTFSKVTPRNSRIDSLMDVVALSALAVFVIVIFFEASLSEVQPTGKLSDLATQMNLSELSRKPNLRRAVGKFITD